MSKYEEAREQAIANVCMGPIDDYSRGFITKEQLDERIRRRLPQITPLVAELLKGPQRQACDCGAEATTIVAGGQYCAACAVRVPRRAAPALG